MNSAREGIHTTVFNMGILQRLEPMHQFFISHIPAYNSSCCVEAVPIILYELFDKSFRMPDFQPKVMFILIIFCAESSFVMFVFSTANG